MCPGIKIVQVTGFILRYEYTWFPPPNLAYKLIKAQLWIPHNT